MTSKKNGALIFGPKHINRTESYFPFKKHEILGGVAHVSHIARKLTFI